MSMQVVILMGHRHYFWWTTFDVMANAGNPKKQWLGMDLSGNVMFLFFSTFTAILTICKLKNMPAPFCAINLSS